MSDKEKKNFPWPTVGVYNYYEVVSALQKSIRRGLEHEALFWSTELYLSDYANHAWQRMLVIASEDIGLSDSNVVVQIHTLHTLWKENHATSDARLFFIHAVLILVRSKKSRIVDNANILYFEGERPNIPIPDYALDVHTSSGRSMGRNQEHFFTEGTVLENVDLSDPYEEQAKGIRIQNDKSKP